MSSGSSKKVVQSNVVEEDVNPDVSLVTYKPRSWKTYLWDSWDKSPEERKLILKLDLTLMTFGCVGTFIKYLDKYVTPEMSTIRITDGPSSNAVVSEPMNSMAFWLKQWNVIKPGSYTVPQINNYVTPIQAVTVVATVFMAWASDSWLRGCRWPMLVLGSSVTAIVDITLASTVVFPEARAGRWVLYYLTGFCQASNSMFWAWTQDTLSGDPATRAFASAGLNVWASLAQAVIPLALFQTVDQPAVVAGNYGSFGFSILHASTALSLAYLQHRRGRRSFSEPEPEVTSDTERADGDSKAIQVGDRIV
ncbi:hypothetical protein SLS62_003291 [Diatrype stigma]|uniref:Uncharacterized protein n=1 Tax=Diatrype stigma TaxID=117547 RepID=A0AAN9V736_9PEZI